MSAEHLEQFFKVAKVFQTDRSLHKLFCGKSLQAIAAWNTSSFPKKVFRFGSPAFHFIISSSAGWIAAAQIS